MGPPEGGGVSRIRGFRGLVRPLQWGLLTGLSRPHFRRSSQEGIDRPCRFLRVSTKRQSGRYLGQVQESVGCGRCGVGLPGDPERCSWCFGALCESCWEEPGHCGHPEAEAVYDGLQLASSATRAAVALALVPEGAVVVAAVGQGPEEA